MERTNPSAEAAGSPGDWRAWYARLGAPLLLYARQWLPGRADAEDAVQAGFVKFWRHRPAAAEADTPLLYAAVRCAALDFLKRQSRRAKREERAALEADEAWWDADPVAAGERADEVRRALEFLPENQREVVVLRVWAGLGFAEIATALGENPNTVAARYRYALSNLKKRITEECHERS